MVRRGIAAEIPGTMSYEAHERLRDALVPRTGVRSFRFQIPATLTGTSGSGCHDAFVPFGIRSKNKSLPRDAAIDDVLKDLEGLWWYSCQCHCLTSQPLRKQGTQARFVFGQLPPRERKKVSSSFKKVGFDTCPVDCQPCQHKAQSSRQSSRHVVAWCH